MKHGQQVTKDGVSPLCSDNPHLRSPPLLCGLLYFLGQNHDAHETLLFDGIALTVHLSTQIFVGQEVMRPQLGSVEDQDFAVNLDRSKSIVWQRNDTGNRGSVVT